MLHLGSTFFIVKDLQTSIDFYEKLLDMKVSAVNKNRFAQFHFDGKCISLYDPSYDENTIAEGIDLDLHFNEAYINYYKKRTIRQGNQAVLNFWIENLNEEYRRIKELGIGEVSDILYVNIACPYYFFVLDDPDGNTIEITGGYTHE
ncbi:MAG: hypothetical protein K0S47_4533 [Herbinix sp.]|jgi:lactoylglutathione lyase|nr:hypothetical protein [Herbinix sp.]